VAWELGKDAASKNWAPPKSALAVDPERAVAHSQHPTPGTEQGYTMWAVGQDRPLSEGVGSTWLDYF